MATFHPTFNSDNGTSFPPSFKTDNGASFGGAGGAGVQWDYIIGKPDVFPPAPHTHPEYAPLDSPALIGTPTAPTPAEGDNSTKLATTAFVNNAIFNAEEVMVAIYGVTPYESITAARAEGKVVFAYYPDEALLLPYTSTTSAEAKHVFSSQIGYYSRIFYCDPSSTWTANSWKVALEDSPHLTGIPTAPTPLAGTRSSQLATTAFVQTEIEERALPLIATYGVTTYSAISAAIATGRPVFGYDPEDNKYYVLGALPRIGDVNLDGLVNADDSTKLARHVGNIARMTDPQALRNADGNDDGVVNALDLNWLARTIVAMTGADVYTFTFFSFDDSGIDLRISLMQISPAGVWNKTSYSFARATTMAPTFAPGAYSIGDYVLYRGELYRATSAVVEADGWQPAQWQKTAITSELVAPPVTSVNGKTGAVVLTGTDINVGDETPVAIDAAFATAQHDLEALDESVDLLATAVGTKQPKIEVSGILKGTGVAGEVQPAVAGTDYQTPLTPGTDYATPAQIPTKTSDLTNDSGFLTQEVDPTVPAWAKASTKPSYTASEVGALPASTSIPTKTSDLTNDSGFLTQEVDPTVPAWAKAPTKPSYTASEVGALPASTSIPTKTSDLTNDSGFLTQEVDPTVPAWAKAATKPSYTASEVGALPASTSIPTKTSDLTNDSGFLTQETDPVFGASPAAGISAADIAAWDGKQDELTPGANIDITSNVISVDGIVPKAALTSAIPFAQVDSTSTATAFTATVPGITELKSGVAVMLKNGVVTSASGFTININNLGAKQAYSNMAAATAETTMFNINYTMIFVYDEDRVEGGGWVLYRGYNSNDNTIGYQLRTNSTSLPMDSITYRYRLLFRSADGTKFVPANNSTSTNATSSRTTIQTPIDPFGPIHYYSTTASVAAGTRPSATYLWTQYLVTLGYSFNRTGAALTLTTYKPVFIKAAPQSNGSAIIDADTPYVQDLPSTKDGKIYIYLGVANSATQLEMYEAHPVYWHDGTGIRIWTGAESSGGGGVSSVTVSQTVQSGTEIAEIAVDGTATKLYTPTIPAPLNGSTATTTPSEVASALAAGRTVYISHLDATVGQIVATYFNTSAALGVIVSNVFAYIGSSPAAVTLAGDLTNDTWSVSVTYLQTILDPVVQYLSVNGTSVWPTQAGHYDISVPTKTSDLTNDSGFLTSAVTSFNGSTGAVTYTAPVASVNGQTGAITGLQTTGNLVTSVSSASTDSQYPSAKLLYDTVGNIEALLAAI